MWAVVGTELLFLLTCPRHVLVLLAGALAAEMTGLAALVAVAHAGRRVGHRAVARHVTRLAAVEARPGTTTASEAAATSTEASADTEASAAACRAVARQVTCLTAGVARLVVETTAIRAGHSVASLTWLLALAAQMARFTAVEARAVAAAHHRTAHHWGTAHHRTTHHRGTAVHSLLHRAVACEVARVATLVAGRLHF